MKRIVRKISKKLSMTDYFYQTPRGAGYHGVLKEVDASDEVTYEQAFEEWKSKPIIFILKSLPKEIYWIIDYWGHENSYLVTNSSGLIEQYDKYCWDDKEIDNIFKASYQASSWRDLHLNVIPALMRMVEGK